NQLFLFDKKTYGETLIQNFTFAPHARYVQIDNILIMIDDENMWKINIDYVRYGNIEVVKTEVFTPAFNTHHGLIQNISGTNHIHYHNGN
ncbi:hypothetical protein ABK046_46935, partial [Streptomyces caeruleatus]